MVGMGVGSGVAAAGSLLGPSESFFIPSGYWYPVLVLAECSWTHLV